MMFNKGKLFVKKIAYALGWILDNVSVMFLIWLYLVTALIWSCFADLSLYHEILWSVSAFILICASVAREVIVAAIRETRRDEVITALDALNDHVKRMQEEQGKEIRRARMRDA